MAQLCTVIVVTLALILHPPIVEIHELDSALPLALDPPSSALSFLSTGVCFGLFILSVCVT